MPSHTPRRDRAATSFSTGVIMRLSVERKGMAMFTSSKQVTFPTADCGP